MRVSVSLLGSCVLRDIFRIGDIDNSFDIKKYVSFISPMSINCNACKDDIEAIENILRLSGDSWTNFSKRCFLQDIKKQAWSYLISEKSDYLLIDMIEIRHPIWQKGHEKLTYRIGHSDLAKKLCKYYTENGYKQVFHKNFAYEEVDNNLELYCKKILSNWSKEKIILVETLPVRSLLGVEGKIVLDNKFDSVYVNESATALVRYSNEVVKKKLECQVIYMPDMQYVLADEKHKWGRYPYHYTDVVYEYLYVQICDIIEGKESKNLKEKLLTKLKSEYYDAYTGEIYG